MRLASIPLMRPRIKSVRSPIVRRPEPVCTITFSSSTLPPLQIYDSDGDEEEVLPARASQSRPNRISTAPMTTTTELYTQAAAVARHPKLQHNGRPPPPKQSHLRPIHSRTVRLQPDPSGYVVLDLFSGLSIALRAWLQNGMRIKAYFAVESDEKARIAARHHVEQLQLQYSHLLPPTLLHNFQSDPGDNRCSVARGWNRGEVCVPNADYACDLAVRVFSRSFPWQPVFISCRSATMLYRTTRIMTRMLRTRSMRLLEHKGLEW